MTTTRTPIRKARKTLDLPDEVQPLKRSGISRSALARLQGEIAHQGLALSKNAALKSWASTLGGASANLARSLVLTRIEWSRALGRPHARALADAFTAVHWRWQEVKMFKPGGAVRWIGLSSPVLPPPVLTEGPHDDTTWRVSVLLLPTHHTKQALELGFAPASDWKGPDGRRVRVAMKPALRYFGPGNGPVVLPAFVLSAAD